MINEKTELLTYDDSFTVGDLQDYLKKSLRVWSVLEDLNEFKDQLKIFKKTYKQELKESNELALRLTTEHKHKLEDLLDLDQLPYVDKADFQELKKSHSALIQEKAQSLEEKLKLLSEDTKKSIKRNFTELDVAVKEIKKQHLGINETLSKLSEITTLQRINDDILQALDSKQDNIDLAEFEKQILDKVNQKIVTNQPVQTVSYTAQNLSRLVDVNISNPTNGQTLVYNTSQQRWVNDAAGSGSVQSVTGLNTDNTDPANPVVQISVDGVTITGAGTPASPLVSTGGAPAGSNTQVQFNDSGSFGGDADFTYNKTTNALTVGGLVHTPIVQAHTSAGLTLETQGGSDVLTIGAGGGVNATAYGGWNFDGATANTIASFGASKTLESLSTATYPSFTELSYVKGVTSAIQTQLDGKVDENAAITGATKTKITYDAKGLVTAGADATTADIADSTNKRYVTDAQLTVIGNTSGTNSGDVTLAGTPDYITISGQVITRGLIDLTTDVTGDLPFANLTPASAASKLLGRGDSGAGDYQEITLGTNLSMSGTTLNASGSGSSAFNDLTSGTNTTAAMVVGTGASLATSGSGTIAATTATTSTNGTVANEATDTTCFPLFVTAATGDLPFKSNAGLAFNSNTGVLTSTFSGNLTGNVTGNADTATTATNATNIATANEAADTTCFPTFVTASGTQTLPAKTNTGLIYNSSTNALTATTFTGALSGNATTATTLQTARAIYGNNFDGSAALTQVIASTYGGTGNGFTKFTGATTSEKTYTLPNANATILTDNATVTVAQGGTGAATLTGLLQGNGTSAFTAISNSSTVGQVLRVTGASTYAWGALDLADSDAITGDLPFANLTQGSALSVLGVTGNATADVASIAAGSDGQVLRRSGTSLAFGAVDLDSANSVTGTLAVANGGTNAATAIEADRNLQTAYVLAQSFVAVNGTAVTSEEVYATITVPANALGANGVVEVYSYWGYTNSANNKVTRIRWGGISGDIMRTSTQTTSASVQLWGGWGNRNNTSSQVGYMSVSGGSFVTSVVALMTATRDTTAAVDIVITGQKASSGETLTLEGYRVIIYPK